MGIDFMAPEGSLDGSMASDRNGGKVTMGILWSTAQAPGPGLLDRLVRPDWSRQQEEATQAETQQKQQQAELMKQQADLIKLNIKEKQQVMDYLGQLDPQTRAAYTSHPKLTTLLMMLTNRGMPGGEQPPPPTVEQTGEFFRPTEEMVGQQQPSGGLPGMLAEQQLMGGIDKNRLIQDTIMHELGYPMENPMGLADTRPMVNPQGQPEIGQLTKGGQTRWTGQRPIPKLDWKQLIHPETGLPVLAPVDEMGNINWEMAQPMPLDITYQGGVAGAGGMPMKVPAPSKAYPGMPVPTLPEAFRLESVPTEGPRGEKGLIQINPYGGGGLSVGGRGAISGGAAGIQTGPAKGPPVPQAQQISMMTSGLEGLKKVKNVIFDSKTGEINRSNLATGKFGVPWTEGKRAMNILGTALNAIRLASTGAAFSEEELEQLKSQYIPSYFANDQQVYDQWDLLTKFVYGMLAQLDPNEVWTPGIRKDYENLMRIPRRGKGLSLQPGKKVKETTLGPVPMTAEEYLNKVKP